MRTFVFRCFAFGSVLFIFLLAILYSHSNTYIKKFKDLEHHYDIINLGTSHGNDFVYTKFGINGEKFNRNGNTLYYDLQNYRYLKPNLNAKAIVVIPVSYFSFGLDENRTDRGIDNPFVNDFYFYLPKKSIYSYSYKKHVEICLNTIRASVFRIVDLPFKKKSIKKPGKFNPKFQMLTEHAIKRSNKHVKLGEFSEPEMNITYLSELIKDALDNGYRPVLVTTPYFENYNIGFDSEWLKTHYFNHIDYLKDEFSIPYFNYSNDERFTKHVNLFQNSDHLNREGSTYFSKVFFEDLRSNGLLQ